MSERVQFGFTLRPLEDVAPWGKSEHHLHWFGVSEGRYWIELGDKKFLPCFSSSTQGAEVGETTQRLPFVDYYVGRYWEDLLQLTLVVMEPVPSDLVPFIESHPDSWAPVESEVAWDAATWHGGHVLDLSYLRLPPHIRMWRTFSDDLDEVRLAWRCHPADDGGQLSDSDGCVRMSTASFLESVKQFDVEFMEAMRQRISELEQTGPPRPKITPYIGELRREQATRTTWLAERLSSEPTTDWVAVRAGARQLLRA